MSSLNIPENKQQIIHKIDDAAKEIGSQMQLFYNNLQDKFQAITPFLSPNEMAKLREVYLNIISPKEEEDPIHALYTKKPIVLQAPTEDLPNFTTFIQETLKQFV